MYTGFLWGIAGALAITIPLAWKWQLGVRRTALFVTGVGIVCGWVSRYLGPGATPVWQGLAGMVGTLGISLGYLAYRFYRDPERVAPEAPGNILSPADGIVIYVKTSADGMLPVSTKHGRKYALSELLQTEFHAAEATVIGISMSLLDVHVNRAPIAGTVGARNHVAGAFGSLRIPENVYQNERSTTILSNGQLDVAIVQIASRLVRQIVSYVQTGDSVANGQRIGAIRLGSQVDVIVPVRPDIGIRVSAGQRVYAGTTVMATYEPAHILSTETDPVANVRTV